LIEFDWEVLLLLAKAHRSLGILDGISRKLPDLLMLVNTISLQEAKSSSEIENIFTSDDILKELLNDLLIFLNNDEKYNIDPLLKMAIGHYQLEAIHPFPDGNGRTGRILNTLILMNKGLLSHPILYLSKYIINNKDGYYHHLNRVSSRGDWKRWLLYMLTAVDETANYTVMKIEEITQQFKATRTHIEKHFPNLDYAVIEAIFTQPYIKAIHLVNEKIKSRNTARKYLDQLCNIQVLELKHIGNENVYINNDLVRILEST